MPILIFVFQKPIFSHIISGSYLSFKIRIIWSSVNLWVLLLFFLYSLAFSIFLPALFESIVFLFFILLSNFLPYSSSFPFRFPSIFPSLNFFPSFILFFMHVISRSRSRFLVCLLNFYSFDIFFNFFPSLHFHFLRYFYFRF